MDATVDTAAAAHRLLELLPEAKRQAALALLELPVDWPVCGIAGPCSDWCDDIETCPGDHPNVGWMTAGTLLRELVRDVASPETVMALLDHRRMVRPGLTGAP